MTAFWQALVSLSAHFAHMPSPVIVTFLSSFAIRALTPENITAAAASINSFRIVGLLDRYQNSIRRLRTLGYGTRTAPLESVLNHLLGPITTTFLGFAILQAR